jgi:mannonate dehydratase
VNSKLSRRELIQVAGVAGAAALAPSVEGAAKIPGPRFEGKGTPRICLSPGDAGRLPTPPPPGAGGAGAGARGAAPAAAPGAAAQPTQAGAIAGIPPDLSADEMQARRLKQLGVYHLLAGGPRMPWDETQLKALMDRYKAVGLTVGNLMISGFNNAIYGRQGRDQEIENVIKSIQAAGKVGLPVVEYNWYAHRAMEGYYEEAGRDGAGYTGFDYSKMKDLPALPNEGAHTLDEMWNTITYFLKAVVPAAEKAGVRLALHPNDPPAPISRGSQQIMGSVDGWKHLIEIVKSPSNGITYDCGVTREMGQDPIDVARYFGSRDRINHVHFRNVKVIKPYERYNEVFIDEGDNDMFAVMKELVKAKYHFLIYPEHPRALDYDRAAQGRIGGYQGGGSYTSFAFQVGYTRAMLQAALSA